MLRKGENLIENGKIWSCLVKQKTNKKKKKEENYFYNLAFMVVPGLFKT